MSFFKKLFNPPNPVYQPNREEELWQVKYNDQELQNLERQHYLLNEKNEENYSVLYNLGIVDGPEMQKLMNDCIGDIACASRLSELWRKYNTPIYSYPAFKRMSIIYEKQGNYESAALMCVQALRLGFTDDGTKGGMRGRLARLVRKSGMTVDAETRQLMLGELYMD